LRSIHEGSFPACYNAWLQVEPEPVANPRTVCVSEDALKLLDLGECRRSAFSQGLHRQGHTPRPPARMALLRPLEAFPSSTAPLVGMLAHCWLEGNLQLSKQACTVSHRASSGSPPAALDRCRQCPLLACSLPCRSQGGAAA